MPFVDDRDHRARRVRRPPPDPCRRRGWCRRSPRHLPRTAGCLLPPVFGSTELARLAAMMPPMDAIPEQITNADTRIASTLMPARRAASWLPPTRVDVPAVRRPPRGTKVQISSRTRISGTTIGTPRSDTRSGFVAALDVEDVYGKAADEGHRTDPHRDQRERVGRQAPGRRGWRTRSSCTAAYPIANTASRRPAQRVRQVLVLDRADHRVGDRDVRAVLEHQQRDALERQETRRG